VALQHREGSILQFAEARKAEGSNWNLIMPMTKTAASSAIEALK